MTLFADAFENFKLVNSTNNIVTPIRFVKFFLTEYLKMRQHSRDVSKIINYFDQKFFEETAITPRHDVYNLEIENYENFRKIFLSFFREHVQEGISGGVQNIFPLSNFVTNTNLMNAVRDYIIQLRKEVTFLPSLLQNAYFVKDFSDIRVPAHEFHRDGLGVRYKVWLILDCDGEMGLDYISTPFDPTRSFATYKSVYEAKNQDPSNAVKQVAFPGQIYCLDTECIHRGFMGEHGSRTSLVMEFIDELKFQSIEGKYFAFHRDKNLPHFVK